MFAQDLGELNALFDGLVQEGSIPAAIWKLARDNFAERLGKADAIPDFCVKLVSGEEFYVEVTTAGVQATIHQETKIPDMSAAMQAWSLTDAKARGRLANVQVGFTPQRMFKAKDEKAALQEMKDFILSEDFADYADDFGVILDSPNYPTLTAARVIVSVLLDSTYSSVTVKSPGGSFSPGGELQAVLAAVQEKLYKGYATFRPIRLVVALQHVIGQVNDIFEGAKFGLTDLGPFERVYFATSNEALVALR
jgi:hypothetical protein